MATRYNYTGGIVTNGLVLNLDAAKTDSYPGTGTTWRDLSGRGNNGTLTNGPTFSGIGKQASIVFDGVDDFVNCGNTSALNMGSGDFTLDLFFKATGSSDFRVLLQKGNAGIGGNRGYRLRIESNNTIQMVLTANSEQTVTTTPIVYNSYYNVCATKSTNGLRIYLNGILSGTNLTSPPGTTDSSNIFIIGSSDNFSSPSQLWPFRGDIPSVKIYNRALTQTEITQNFNALRGRYGI